MAGKKPTSADLLVAQKYRLIEKLIDAGKVPVWLLVSYVPLVPISHIAATLAGKSTHVDVAVTAALSWSVVASGGWARSAGVSRGRKKRLESGRERADSLEARMLENKEQTKT